MRSAIFATTANSAWVAKDFEEEAKELDRTSTNAADKEQQVEEKRRDVFPEVNGIERKNDTYLAQQPSGFSITC